jgi:hypothetical protein
MTSTIKVNTIQNTCGADIIKESGNTITIGASGDTVTLGSGASQSGFGRTGTVDWQTGSIKTADFTAANGEGYFVNTTSGVVTVTLPSSPSAGNIVAIADYAGTSATNKITINRNSSPLEGGTTNGEISTNRQTATLVYVDATQGWIAVNSNDSQFIAPQFVAASGGTITTCGNFKVHTFTGPGTLCVSSAGNAFGSSTLDYFVVAGGGGGSGRDVSGGGGAGGFRLSNSVGCLPAPSMSPLANPTGLPVTATGYPITVGAGGAGSVCSGVGTNGVNSVFTGSSTITSAGGGGGGRFSCGAGANGGSGGGGGRQGTGGGSGNTPPVSPPQGNPGGDGEDAGGNADGGGGGGGAGEAGKDGRPSGPAAGGDGSFISPAMGGSNGTPGPASGRYFGGGGGGAQHRNEPNPTVSPGPGGAGGGGQSGAVSGANGVAGTANTGGGGGASRGAPATGGAGGSGIVIIRYKYQ